MGSALTLFSLEASPFFMHDVKLDQVDWGEYFREVYFNFENIPLHAFVLVMAAAAGAASYIVPQLNILNKESTLKGIARSAEYVLRYGIRLYGKKPPIGQAARFILEHSDDPIQKQEASGLLNLLNGNYDTAIDCYADAVSDVNQKPRQNISGHLHKIAQTTSSRFIRFLRPELQEFALLEAALDDLRNGFNLSSAKDNLRILATGQSQHQAEFACLYAYLLDKVQDKDANQEWQRAALLLFNDPSLPERLRVVHHSKHQFLEYEPSGIIRGSLGFLRSKDHEHLHKIYRLYRFFNEVVWSGGEETPTPLAYLSDPEYHYVVLKRARGKRLDELLRSVTDAEPINKTTSTLAELHDRAWLALARSGEYKVSTEQEPFTKRIWDCLDRNYLVVNGGVLRKLQDALVPILDKLAEKMRKRPFPIHGDFHPGNIILADAHDAGESGGVCILDPEYFTCSLHEIDVAALLEHSAARGHCFYSGLNNYLSSQTTVFHESRAEFTDNYTAVAVGMNILYGFHALRKPPQGNLANGIPIWRGHIERAIEHLRRLELPDGQRDSIKNALEMMIEQSERVRLLSDPPSSQHK